MRLKEELARDDNHRNFIPSGKLDRARVIPMPRFDGPIIMIARCVSAKGRDWGPF